MSSAENASRRLGGVREDRVGFGAVGRSSVGVIVESSCKPLGCPDTVRVSLAQRPPGYVVVLARHLLGLGKEAIFSERSWAEIEA